MRLALAATLVACAAPASAAPAAPVAAMRGERRVVLLFAPSRRDPAFVAQETDFAGTRDGLHERDMTVVTIVGDDVTGASDDAGALRSRYGAAPAAFTMLLIGKDGHVADRRHVAVPADRLFAAIDAMPMRRDEMRRRTR
jgi:hypothetical protein